MKKEMRDVFYELKVYTETGIDNLKLKTFDFMKKVSNDEFSKEFIELIRGKYFVEMLDKYRNLFTIFIPELRPMFNFNQKNKYHIYDLWNHTLETLRFFDEAYEFNNITLEELMKFRLVMLFHDISKPINFREKEDGSYIYIGHAIKSSEMAKTIFQRLNINQSEFISKKIIEEVILLIKYHDYEMPNKDKSIIRFMKDILGYKNSHLCSDYLWIKLADIWGQNKDLREERLIHYCKITERCIILKEEKKLIINRSQLFITGNDLKEIGFKDKQIGIVFNDLLNDVSYWNIKNNKNELIKLAKKRFKKINSV